MAKQVLDKKWREGTACISLLSGAKDGSAKAKRSRTYAAKLNNRCRKLNDQVWVNQSGTVVERRHNRCRWCFTARGHDLKFSSEWGSPTSPPAWRHKSAPDLPSGRKLTKHGCRKCNLWGSLWSNRDFMCQGFQRWEVETRADLNPTCVTDGEMCRFYCLYPWRMTTAGGCGKLSWGQKFFAHLRISHFLQCNYFELKRSWKRH